MKTTALRPAKTRVFFAKKPAKAFLVISFCGTSHSLWSLDTSLAHSEFVTRRVVEDFIKKHWQNCHCGRKAP